MSFSTLRLTDEAGGRTYSAIVGRNKIVLPEVLVDSQMHLGGPILRSVLVLIMEVGHQYIIVDANFHDLDKYSADFLFDETRFIFARSGAPLDDSLFWHRGEHVYDRTYALSEISEKFDNWPRIYCQGGIYGLSECTPTITVMPPKWMRNFIANKVRLDKFGDGRYGAKIYVNDTHYFYDIFNLPSKTQFVAVNNNTAICFFNNFEFPEADVEVKLTDIRKCLKTLKKNRDDYSCIAVQEDCKFDPFAEMVKGLYGFNDELIKGWVMKFEKQASRDLQRAVSSMDWWPYDICIGLLVTHDSKEKFSEKEIKDFLSTEGVHKRWNVEIKDMAAFIKQINRMNECWWNDKITKIEKFKFAAGLRITGPDLAPVRRGRAHNKPQGEEVKVSENKEAPPQAANSFIKPTVTIYKYPPKQQSGLEMLEDLLTRFYKQHGIKDKDIKSIAAKYYGDFDGLTRDFRGEFKIAPDLAKVKKMYESEQKAKKQANVRPGVSYSQAANNNPSSVQSSNVPVNNKTKDQESKQETKEESKVQSPPSSPQPPPPTVVTPTQHLSPSSISSDSGEAPLVPNSPPPTTPTPAQPSQESPKQAGNQGECNKRKVSFEDKFATPESENANYDKTARNILKIATRNINKRPVSEEIVPKPDYESEEATNTLEYGPRRQFICAQSTIATLVGDTVDTILPLMPFDGTPMQVIVAVLDVFYGVSLVRLADIKNGCLGKVIGYVYVYDAPDPYLCHIAADHELKRSPKEYDIYAAILRGPKQNYPIDAKYGNKVSHNEIVMKFHSDSNPSSIEIIFWTMTSYKALFEFLKNHYRYDSRQSDREFYSCKDHQLYAKQEDLTCVNRGVIIGFDGEIKVTKQVRFMGDMYEHIKKYQHRFCPTVIDQMSHEDVTIPTRIDCCQKAKDCLLCCEIKQMSKELKSDELNAISQEKLDKMIATTNLKPEKNIAKSEGLSTADRVRAVKLMIRAVLKNNDIGSINKIDGWFENKSIPEIVSMIKEEYGVDIDVSDKAIQKVLSMNDEIKEAEQKEPKQQASIVHEHRLLDLLTLRNVCRNVILGKANLEAFKLSLARPDIEKQIELNLETYKEVMKKIGLNQVLINVPRADLGAVADVCQYLSEDTFDHDDDSKRNFARDLPISALYYEKLMNRMLSREITPTKAVSELHWIETRCNVVQSRDRDYALAFEQAETFDTLMTNRRIQMLNSKYYANLDAVYRNRDNLHWYRFDGEQKIPEHLDVMYTTIRAKFDGQQESDRTFVGIPKTSKFNAFLNLGKIDINDTDVQDLKVEAALLEFYERFNPTRYNLYTNDITTIMHDVSARAELSLLYYHDELYSLIPHYTTTTDDNGNVKYNISDEEREEYEKDLKRAIDKFGEYKKKNHLGSIIGDVVNLVSGKSLLAYAPRTTRPKLSNDMNELFSRCEHRSKIGDSYRHQLSNVTTLRIFDNDLQCDDDHDSDNESINEEEHKEETKHEEIKEDEPTPDTPNDEDSSIAELVGTVMVKLGASIVTGVSEKLIPKAHECAKKIAKEIKDRIESHDTKKEDSDKPDEQEGDRQDF